MLFSFYLIFIYLEDNKNYTIVRFRKYMCYLFSKHKKYYHKAFINQLAVFSAEKEIQAMFQIS